MPANGPNQSIIQESGWWWREVIERRVTRDETVRSGVSGHKRVEASGAFKMHQPSRPPARRYADPEIASAAAVRRATLSAARAPSATAHRQRSLDPRLETFGIVVLAPEY